MLAKVKKSNQYSYRLGLLICALSISYFGMTTNYVFISSSSGAASYTNPVNWEGGLVGPTTLGPTDTVTFESVFTVCQILVAIENNGLILIQSNATVLVFATMTNNGIIRNHGDFQNWNTITSYGTFDNNWSFHNTQNKVFENCGTFTSSYCKNSGRILNKGLFHVEGNFIDDTLYTSSKFENDGALFVEPFAEYFMGLSFKNFASGSITNDGEIKTFYTTPAVVFNYGHIYNKSGTIDIHPLFIVSDSNAKISGKGLINAYSANIDGVICPDGPLQIITQFPCIFTDSATTILNGGIENPLHFSNVGFSGILKVFFNNYQPPVQCIDYVIITFDQLYNAQGFTTFDSLDLPETYPGFKWEVVYNTNDVTLRYYPDDENNNALSFQSLGNMDSSYVQVQSNIGIAKTIEFRFFPEKTNPSEPGEMIISLDNSAGSYILSMGLTSAVEGETMSLTNGAGMIYTTYPFDKEWYHVAFVAEVNHYTKIFVNGMPVPVFFRNADQPANYDIDSFRIGARKSYPQGFTQAFFGGMMDEFRFWSYARSDVQILESYYKELSNPEEFGLRAYYPMNQGKRNDSNQCIDFLTDVSGFGNHGTLHEFVLAGTYVNWVGSPTCQAILPAENIFIGEAGDSTSWFEDENWSMGIPSGCHHVIIPDGMQVMVDAAEANCFTIEVKAGGNLEVLESRTLDVKLSAY